jgi:hypothetical protein
MMTDESTDSLSVRACRVEEKEVVLELWRQADATPGVTDTADDLRRAIADSPAHVLVAAAEGRLVGSIIGMSIPLHGKPRSYPSAGRDEAEST